MIINYPTGLYVSVLPKEPQDSQNITYLISTTSPPRTSLLFPKIPIGIALHQREPRQLTTVERRQTVSDLLFTISRASRQQSGNNAKQYEIGEVLPFEDTNLKTTNPMLVAEKTEIQHNLNKFDYEELGLTESDVAIIDTESQKTFSTVAQRLNELRVARSNSEVTINTQQKIVNEASKNIVALEAMAEASDSTGSDILALIDKLTVRKRTAAAALQAAIVDANAYATEADEQLARLRAIATVLK